LASPLYPHPLIAREGWPYLGGISGAALLVTIVNGVWWAIPLWIAALFVLQFFRDQARAVTAPANAVVSPADGRIVAVMPVTDPWLNRPALKISVFMNVFNVHSNRSPVDGEVIAVHYHPGSFVNADLDKASEQNERNAVCLRTVGGHEISCVQVAGLIARRILCYVGSGASLLRGQRYGFIRFGSRVDVYLPPGARVRVAIGDKVSAALSVLAELP